MLLIGIAVFANLLVICVLVYRWHRRDKLVVSQRIGQYVEMAAWESYTESQGQPTGELTGWRALVRRLSRLFETTDTSWLRRTEHRLIQAGLPLKGSEFMAICSLASLGVAILVLIVKGNFIGAVLGAILGYWIPHIVLNIKIKRRAKAFNDQLGDTLILIANALKTGYSFMQAIEMVSREMLPPISVEFGRTLKEMNLGVPTEEAMNNMAKRIDSDDLDLVITAVLIQRQVGGNLAEVLNNIAATIRERVRIKGEIKTLTAQGRMSGIVISLLPAALMAALHIINPDYIGLLFHHPTGQLMLGMSLVGQILGMLLVRKIVDIEI